MMNADNEWTWRVRVTWEGERSALNYLLQMTDLGDFLYLEGESVYFNLVDAEAIQDSKVAEKKAVPELCRANGIAATSRMTGQFVLSAIESNTPSQAPTQYMTMRGFLGTAVGIPTITALNSEGQPIPPRRKSIRTMAEENAHLDKALRIIGTVRDDDWAMLYNITELIRTLPSGLIVSWQKNAALERIEKAANNPSITGDFSRHAVSKGTPPKSQTDFQTEKEELIQILNLWIDHLDKSNH